MITQERFKEQHAQLNEMMQKVYQTEDTEYQVEIIYGYADAYRPEPKFGWHEVVTDYPGFAIFFLGATFEDALENVTKQYEEYLADLQDEEGEDE